MLQSTDEEREHVVSYFGSQAPDLEITFSQKIYSEQVLSQRHDVWDVHTNKDRWWVITNPTNLYSQEQFPNLDYAVTFHMGLCLRTPRSLEHHPSPRQITPFGEVFELLDQVQTALTQAHNVSGYQAVGMQAREVLLSFIGVIQDSNDWRGDALPKRADFKGWSDLFLNEALCGRSQKERRHLFKTLMFEAWDFANWLTHSKSATWNDAEACTATVAHVIGLSSTMLIRWMRDVPEECPKCGSPHLEPQEGRHTEKPGIVWERPVCNECGWTGKATAIDEEPVEDFGEIIKRFRAEEENDECIIPTVPLRKLKRPSDE